MSFLAKYRGVCDECGGDVRPGDEVTFTAFADGEIRHVRCPDDTSLRRAGRVCPKCFIELPSTGVCDDCDG